MKKFSVLLLILMTIVLYGPIVKSVVIMTGAPNIVAPLRDVMLIILGIFGFVYANPLRAPRLLWGVITLIICVCIYLAVAATEDQYAAGLYYARSYLLPVFFMMALAGAITSIDRAEADNFSRYLVLLTLFTVLLSLVLYAVMLLDPAIASKLISGVADMQLADAWYISGNRWMRMGLPATSPNNLGLQLAMSLGFMIVLFASGRPVLRGLTPWVMGLAFLALLMTFSRSSALLLMVIVFTLWITNQISIPLRFSLPALSGGVIAAAIAWFGLSILDPDSTDSILHWFELNLTGQDPSMQGHLLTFEEAWDGLPDYYLHGYPKGTAGPLGLLFSAKANNVENSVLCVIYDMGIPLSSLFFLGWGLALSHFYRHRVQLAIFAGFFVCSQFLPYFNSAEALIAFVFIFSLTGLIGELSLKRQV